MSTTPYTEEGDEAIPVKTTRDAVAAESVRNAVEKVDSLKVSLIKLNNALAEIGLKPETKRCICQKCGKEWHFDYAKFCSECGKRLQEAPVEDSL